MNQTLCVCIASQVIRLYTNRNKHAAASEFILILPSSYSQIHLASADSLKVTKSSYVDACAHGGGILSQMWQVHMGLSQWNILLKDWTTLFLSILFLYKCSESVQCIDSPVIMSIHAGKHRFEREEIIKRLYVGTGPPCRCSVIVKCNAY